MTCQHACRNLENAIALLGAAGFGVSLYLIHIYVTPIKRTLQLLWAAGVIGGTTLMVTQVCILWAARLKDKLPNVSLRSSFSYCIGLQPSYTCNQYLDSKQCCQVIEYMQQVSYRQAGLCPCHLDPTSPVLSAAILLAPSHHCWPWLQPQPITEYVASHQGAVWAVGPLFAAVTGVAFKEGVCYGKPECAALFFLTPALLLGAAAPSRAHLSGLCIASPPDTAEELWRDCARKRIKDVTVLFAGQASVLTEKHAINYW